MKEEEKEAMRKCLFHFFEVFTVYVSRYPKARKIDEEIVKEGIEEYIRIFEEMGGE